MPFIIFYMLKLKNIISILILSYSSVIMANDAALFDLIDTRDKPTEVKKVRITAPKAVVYADENMFSPIGYIAYGKIIKVGNPRKVNRDLVPLIINGKIAFIEVKNINYNLTSDAEFFNVKGPPKDHDIDLVLPREPEDLTIGNSIFFSLNQFVAGDEFKSAVYDVSNEEKGSLFNIDINAIHRLNNSDVFWGIGFQYNYLSIENFNFNYWTVNPTIGTKLTQNKLFLIDVYGTLDFSLTSLIEEKGNEWRSTAGFMYGGSVNVRAILFPKNKYKIFGQLGYKHLVASKLETLRDANNLEVTGFSKLSGPTIGAGVALTF